MYSWSLKGDENEKEAERIFDEMLTQNTTNVVLKSTRRVLVNSRHPAPKKGYTGKHHGRTIDNPR